MGPSLADPAPDTRLGHQGLFFYSFDPAYSLEPTAYGLYFNRNRWLSPTLGRYLTRDPNATAQPVIAVLVMGGKTFGTSAGVFEALTHYGDGLNLYAYLQSSPIGRTDPSGLSFLDLLSSLASEANTAYTTYQTTEAAGNLIKNLAMALLLRNITLTAVVEMTADAGSLGLDILTGPGAKLLSRFGQSVGKLAELGQRQRYIQKIWQAARYGAKQWHHMIPSAALNRLRDELPDVWRAVVGKKGDKNIFEIPLEVHEYLHGEGGKGGWWNAMWNTVVDEIIDGKVKPEKAIERLKLLRKTALAALGIDYP